MTRRAGFTLIELLAASALAAVLMLVLFQVIGSLGRTRAALRDAPAAASTSAWGADLLDALRWDLANATALKLEPGRLTVTGHGSLDRRSLAPAHRPVMTVWELARQGGGRAALVRRQAPRGGLTNERAWSEIVCADVAGFAVEPVREERPVIPLAPDPLAAPLRVRVLLRGGAMLDEVLVIR